MTSRQIIIDLVDKQLITGEEAFVLINDVLQSEILESWKALNNKSNSDLLNLDGSKQEKSYSWTNTPPSWIYTPTTTASNVASNIANNIIST